MAADRVTSVISCSLYYFTASLCKPYWTSFISCFPQLSPLPRLASPWLRWSVCQRSARGWHLLCVSCSPSRRLPGVLWHDYRRRRLDGESEENTHNIVNSQHTHTGIKLLICMCIYWKYCCILTRVIIKMKRGKLIGTAGLCFYKSVFTD